MQFPNTVISNGVRSLESSILCITANLFSLDQRQKELATPNYEYLEELLQIELELNFLSYHAVANRPKEIFAPRREIC